MTNTQLFLAIGIPSVLILLGILLNRQDNQNTRSELTSLRSEFYNKLDSGLGGMRAEMVAFRDAVHRDMVSLHERVAVVESSAKQ